ncbi:MAG TPA: hypothetical protein VHZ04_00565 [Candidatus Paceibacterota bacterium]|jgi:hypothetical protein|nr:hypothetical protein [Candidatus Paceibacterota bacterium]
MKSNLAATMLRWGLAFVFFYVAIAALKVPFVWAAYLPGFLAFIPSKGFIICFSIYSFILAIWLFWGRKVIWSSIVAAITLAVVILVKLSDLDLVFPTIGLFFSALALHNLAREKDFKEENGEEV